MVNQTVINGTQLIKENMPVQPENIITIIAVFFILFLLVGIGFWIWTKVNG